MTPDLADRYEASRASDDDLDAVVGVVEAADQTLGVPYEPIREELLYTWHLPTTDFERDTRVVREGGTVVAYGEAIWRHPDEGGPLQLFVRVHPDHRGAGIGTWLVEWGERLARERGSPGIRSFIVDRDAPAHELLRARGYLGVRSVFTMRKDLEAGEVPGSPPAGVTIRPYEDADERVLFELHEASFAEHWGFRPRSFDDFNEDLHGEGWDPALVCLADADGEEVGYIVPFFFGSYGYIGILGVVKPWRGRGIAKALLRWSFADLASRGAVEVRLNVDAQNVHGAVALYEGVGMAAIRRYDLLDLGTDEAKAQMGVTAASTRLAVPAFPDRTVPGTANLDRVRNDEVRRSSHE
jgi:mycothiol synthase